MQAQTEAKADRKEFLDTSSILRQMNAGGRGSNTPLSCP